MITGDNKKTAKKIASKVGIKNILADVLPNEKASKVYALSRTPYGIEHTAFVGDGVNDAPALATANVGIAIESAGITLLHKDFSSVLTVYNLSHAVMNIIKQNLFFLLVTILF